MPRIQYLSSKGQIEEASGSDKRLDTSSRSSERIHYVSRDDGQAYTVVSHDPTGAAGTFALYLQNISSAGLLLYVDKIRTGGIETTLWKVFFVTGIAAGGSVLTPVNMNKSSSSAAAANARGDDSITGLTTDGEIASFRTDANSHDEVKFDDAVILGQNDAIAIEVDTDDGTPNIVEMDITFYMETSE